MIKFIPGFAATNAVWENQVIPLSEDFPITNMISDYLIAWSMGIFEAVRLYFENKDVIRKMVLVSGTPKFLKADDYDHGLSPALFRNLERKLTNDFTEGIDFFHGLIFNGKIHPIMRKLPQFEKEAILKDLERLKNEDIRGFLHKIEIPVLLIHGSDDQICLPSASKYMSKIIPNSKLVIFEGSGHAPFLDDPKRFNKTVRSFFRGAA